MTKYLTVIAKVTLLSALFTLTGFAHNGVDHVAEKAVSEVLTKNASGFESGDLVALDKLWAAEASVFESGHANWGWDDYRNHHLAPEIKEMKDASYKLSDIKVKTEGKLGWATFKYALSGAVKDRKIDVKGLGTAILVKSGEDWKIVHWHTSAPRRPSPAVAAPK